MSTAVKVAAVAASLSIATTALLVAGLALLVSTHERRVTQQAGDDDA